MNRFILIFTLAGLAFSSCNEKKTPTPPPVPVNLYTVKSQRVFYYDEYPATTAALSQVDIRPEVQGYITGIFFTEGSYVKKGQRLYEIDRRLYQANYDAAAANVKVAEANQRQAQQDADRYIYLNEHNAVAKQVLDHAVIALQSAKDQTSAAEQAVKTAATNLTYSIIEAPFTGTIGFSQVKLGNMVTVGTTVLNTISTDDPMAVDFLVNEAQLQRFQQIEQKKKAVDSLFTIVLPNHNLYPGTGKISVIDRAVDAQTGSIRVRLVFPNPQHTLRVGMSCILRVHNQDASPQMVIPERAVVEQMGEYFVFIAKDTLIARTDSAKKTSDSAASVPRLRAYQVKVQLGQTIGANIVIKSGIQDGDRIIVDGVQAIHEGSEINASSRPSGASGRGSDSSPEQKKDTSRNN
ncbi:MAG TPA: efflux RND transporter periplasmic adaptor subunit [Puia sp.]|nr:efflux RND transporter periplasmic adaptor subunit [Puia sp.]